MLEIRIGAHVRRVLASEFEPNRREARGCRLLHRMPHRDRARERHEVDLGRSDRAVGRRIAHMEKLKYSLG